MTAKKVTKKRASKKKEPSPTEQRVVFAFRLLPEERDLIHKKAGPASASAFARNLLVSCARGEVEKVAAIAESMK